MPRVLSCVDLLSMWYIWLLEIDVDVHSGNTAMSTASLERLVGSRGSPILLWGRKGAGQGSAPDLEELVPCALSGLRQALSAQTL